MKTTLFESSTPLRLLGIFLDSPRSSLYEKEAALAAGVSLGAANSHLASLVQEGLVTVERKGKMKFYSLNRENPSVRHLKVAWNLSRPVLSQVKKVARAHGLRAYLFGKKALGRDTGQVFDILFLGSVERGILKQKIRSLEQSAGVKINMAQFTLPDWESRADPELRDLFEKTRIQLA